MLKDLQGGFLSGLTPNDRIFEVRPQGRTRRHGRLIRGRKIVFDMMGCCPPEGMRALYLAWRDTVVETPEGVLVNLAFDRDAPKAKVVSQMPRQGQMTVTAKADGRFLSARAGLGAAIGGEGQPGREACRRSMGRSGRSLRSLSHRRSRAKRSKSPGRW